MGVGTPDVDHPLEAAGEFVPVVGDVRGEVGGDAVTADHHPVLVVAVVGGTEPERPVLLVDEPFFLHLGDGGGDLAVIEERLLGEPVIQTHPEGLQVQVDPLQDQVAPHLGEEGYPLFLGNLEEAVAVLGDSVAGDVLYVIALVAVSREFHLLPEQLPVAQQTGETEGIHLVAGVVYVVFALHLESCSG